MHILGAWKADAELPWRRQIWGYRVWARGSRAEHDPSLRTDALVAGVGSHEVERLAIALPGC